MRARCRPALTRWSKLFLVVALADSAFMRVPMRLEEEPHPVALRQRPAVGAVGHLTPGVSRGDVRREMRGMRAAGIRWVRVNQNWAAAEPAGSGVLDRRSMADVDYAVDQARAAGLEVLMPLADGVPYWASADPAKHVDASGVRRWNKLWRPRNMPDYAAFVRRMVTRYKALGVKVYEVWNEPNHPRFWPSGPNAGEYQAMLAAAYPAIKAADPSATVLLGGLSKSDWEYLGEVYAAGGGPYFDAVAIHPYTGSVDPTWCWSQAGTAKRAKDAFCGIEEIRNTMVANGDSAKGLWLTEFGWSTATAEHGVGEATQAEFLTKALTKVQSSYPYVTAAFWYSFRDTIRYGSGAAELEAKWGLVRADFTRKPAWNAVKSFISSLPPVGTAGDDITAAEGIWRRLRGLSGREP